jgi:hypothetical protein
LATFTFATTLVVGMAAACSNGGDDNTCCPPYGAPPPFDAGPQDDGGISTHYGLPGDADIFDDASPDDAALIDSGDAGEDAD